uniref:Metallo-beta-lactamase domain-containing protein n=1 Tax=Acrobeloides nanus TaxID=290746 RepID=A0A914DH70_9BILA
MDNVEDQIPCKKSIELSKPRLDGQIFSNPNSFSTWKGIPGTLSFMSYKTSLALRKGTIIPSKEVMAKDLPVIKPKFDLKTSLSATWLGHATLFVHMNGANFITDPVWSSYAAPSVTLGLTQKRICPSPCSVEELPHLNFGVISHNHYDHLDQYAVQKISELNPEMRWFVPLGLKSWMEDTINLSSIQVIEMNWDEEQTIKIGQETFQIWCIPAQHWSQRTLFDRNKSLWSGWVVLNQRHRFLYTGDTGFCEKEYEKIGKKFGYLDLAAIPIGCYSPRSIMSSQHIDPGEAVKIHKLICARNSIGIHWGTYDMDSSEKFLHPPLALQEEAKEQELREGEFFTIYHGETVSYPFSKNEALKPLLHDGF